MLIAAIPAEFGDEEEAQALIDPRIGTRARRRRRQFVSKMFSEHCPIYTRRAYRMPASAFWRLERLLRPKMIKKRLPKIAAHRKKDGARNGRITTAIRLSAAIRYFAGGRPDVNKMGKVGKIKISNGSLEIYFQPNQ